MVSFSGLSCLGFLGNGRNIALWYLFFFFFFFSLHGSLLSCVELELYDKIIVSNGRSFFVGPYSLSLSLSLSVRIRYM